MIKKFLSVALTFVMSIMGIFALASCGSGDVVEIEFFQHNQSDEAIFNKIIEDFQTVYPHYRVKQICLPEEEADTVLALRFQNDDIPDVFNEWFGQGMFDALDEGKIRDMSNSELLQYIDSSVVENTKYNDKVFMLPMTVNYMGVYYNKDIFTQYNLEIPETLNDLWTVCETLKAHNITPIAAADKDGWNLAHWVQSLIGMYMPNYSSDFKAIFDGSMRGDEMDGISDVADIVVRRTSYVQNSPLGADTDAGISEFALGRTAMFINGSWVTNSIEEANRELNYGVFPFPGPTKDATTIMSNADYSFVFSARANAEKQEVAETFVRYMFTVGAKYYIEQTRAPSCVKGIVADSSRYSLIQDIMNDGKIFRMPQSGRWLEESYLDYTVALQNLVLTGNKTQFYKDFEDALYSVGMPKTYID